MTFSFFFFFFFLVYFSSFDVFSRAIMGTFHAPMLTTVACRCASVATVADDGSRKLGAGRVTEDGYPVSPDQPQSNLMWEPDFYNAGMPPCTPPPRNPFSSGCPYTIDFCHSIFFLLFFLISPFSLSLSLSHTHTHTDQTTRPRRKCRISQ